MRVFLKVWSKGYASVCFMWDWDQRHPLHIENTGEYFDVHQNGAI
jgi:hypothetical protein